MVLGTPEAAIAVALAVPGSRVALFVPTWPEVDAARVLVAARGLEERVAVHHASAAPRGPLEMPAFAAA
jgi:hypothetical protein